MKKSVIMGMVLVTTMSFSAFGAGKSTLLERVAQQRESIQESLYGREKADKDGKPGKIISLASMPEAVLREKQDALIAKVTSDRGTELRRFIREGTKAEQITRMEALEHLLAAKLYAESVKDNAEATEILATAEAMVKLLANSTAAKDRGDEATMILAEQAPNILKWSSTQRRNVTKIANLQDKYMSEGMESRPALEKGYGEVKGITDTALIKKAVDKIKELCKV